MPLICYNWTELEQIFQALLEQGIANREFKADTDTLALAATINMTLQGISVMAKAGTPDEHLGRIVSTLFSLLENTCLKTDQPSS